jgi:hypothetical protein
MDSKDIPTNENRWGFPTLRKFSTRRNGGEVGFRNCCGDYWRRALSYLDGLDRFAGTKGSGASGLGESRLETLKSVGPARMLTEIPDSSGRW